MEGMKEKQGASATVSFDVTLDDEAQYHESLVLGSQNPADEAIDWVLSEVRLSPSKINTFLKCPRQYFHKYIEKLPDTLTIHLFRGTLVHTLLEEMFTKQFRYASGWQKGRAVKWVGAEFDERWADLVETKPWLFKKYDEAQFRLETRQMLVNFCYHIERKLAELMDWGIYRSKDMAFNNIRPRFSELRLHNKEYNTMGYIDAVVEDFEQNISIIDYKTSKRYKPYLPDDYYRQLIIYALLYYEETGVVPAFAGVNWLRYDDTYFVRISSTELAEARQILIDTHTELLNRGDDINNYEKVPQKLCEWCAFYKKPCNPKGENK